MAVKLPRLLDMYMNLPLTSFFDFRSNGATALKSSNWPYALMSMYFWISEISVSTSLRFISAMPALAITTSRLSTLCSEVKDAMPPWMELMEANSISITTRRDPGAFGNDRRDSAVEVFRAVATTVVSGRLRYSATRPLPMPVPGRLVWVLSWTRRGLRTAIGSCYENCGHCRHD